MRCHSCNRDLPLEELQHARGYGDFARLEDVYECRDGEACFAAVLEEIGSSRRAT